MTFHWTALLTPSLKKNEASKTTKQEFEMADMKAELPPVENDYTELDSGSRLSAILARTAYYESIAKNLWAKQKPHMPIVMPVIPKIQH